MIKRMLNKMIDGETLSELEAEAVMQEVMGGEAEPTQVASLLTMMRLRGESVEELTGFAKAMRDLSKHVDLGTNNVLDTCGTGGDGHSTFNISTAAAIGLSACGIQVAKHGNRFVSSKSGSADVLEKLNVPIANNHSEAKQILATQQLVFLFAPLFHTAMKHVAPIRKNLGFRTVFNVLGPLTNPARANYQVVGVWDAEYGKKMAHVLKRLGTKRALFVTGEDGMDEMTITGATYVTELNEGIITSYTVTPEMFGLKRAALEEIEAKTINDSAQIIQSIFNGTSTSAAHDILVLNMAAGLYVTGAANSIQEGVSIADEAIKSKSALAQLQQLREEEKAHA
ncbi:anthranilate phosphoribosyltransferase [Bacillaceae bacterium JMAK1]|nr:anthranilate phosphoribosyltransferase [Bacillaceae bacterium JMAK1]